MAGDAPTRQAVVGRVVVATAGAARDAALLEIAAALAASRSVELLALLVEDMNLQHVAGLPFAAEIDRASGLPRTLDASRMERLMRKRVRDLETLLGRVRERRRLVTSWRSVRGHVVREGFSAAGESDLLVVGAYRSVPHPPQSGGQPGGRRTVAAIVADLERDRDVLRTALELQRAERARLLVLCPAGAGSPGATLEQELAPLLAGTPHRVVGVRDGAGLLEAAAGYRAHVLVVNRRTGLEAGETLARYLERPNRSVVLVP